MFDPREVTGERNPVDTDIHATPASVADLEPYLESHWREYIATSQFKGPTDPTYPANMATSRNPELEQVDGRPPGSTLASVQSQALDPWGTATGILNCVYGVDTLKNPDLAVSIATAANDWLACEWLAEDSRLRASVVVTPQNPVAAAAEIEARADDERFVQVLLPVRAGIPYGNRIYRPLFDAADAAGLPVCIHFGGASGLPPTSSGWPTYYIEDYVDMASAFQSQVTSLIAEGVFDRHPDMKVVLAEAGFSWFPGFIWRFDKGWKGLRREIPWSKHLPSEYAQEHIRFTLQPNDGPSDPVRSAALIDQLPSEEMLMFSTDFPHLHFRDASEVVPPGLSDAQLDGIFSGNAHDFYELKED